jgi:phosphohistidine swiveling domain-containing protein
MQAEPDFTVPLSGCSAGLPEVGGKGASLARLAAAGLPVPPGFCITTAAYRGFVAEHGLQEQILAAVAAATPDQPATLEEASHRIGRLFAQQPIPDDMAEAIRRAYAGLGEGDVSVAVRSSATAEDLPGMSFAGQQESYLNIRGAEAVLEAVKKCWASLWTARAVSYRARQGITPDSVAMAVVVQVLIQADAAGVLFTANPLTGKRDEILINAAWGLGEAIVSGAVTPDALTVERATGRVIRRAVTEKQAMTILAEGGTHVVPVPDSQKKRMVLSDAQAGELAGFGRKIDDLYGMPMDVEWALAGGRFAILQARPVTSLPIARQRGRGSLGGTRVTTFPKPGYDPITGEWNDSLIGDYCWSSVNFREAAPDVMTPSTWSLMWIYIHKITPVRFPGDHPAGGNIAGRLYFNLSLISSLYHAVGMDARRERFGDLLGSLPAELDIPYLELSPLAVIWNVLPGMIRDRMLTRRDCRQFPKYITFLPEWCRAMCPRIQQCTTASALLSLWTESILPTRLREFRMLRSITISLSEPATKLNLDLAALAGEAEAKTLLSSLSGASADLESLGPLVGLAKVMDGRMSREEYTERCGHRGPHEGELSAPDTSDDPEWLDKRLADFVRSGVDVSALLARQHAEFTAAWRRFEARFPGEYKVFRRRLGLVATAAKNRERIRSEGIRLTRLIRQFLLHAGRVTGTGDGIFFLTVDEMASLLAGDKSPLGSIPARREMYRRYCALPPYPAVIYGRFDPFRWAADPNRRTDFYDARQTRTAGFSSAIRGIAAASGYVEGVVRRIDRIEDGDQIERGEILVTSITNIGWTPLFPRLGAIVTDVGELLSHAAIVAREMGIPAVVGCGNATMLLKTGDHVRVDGEHGIVEVLSG